MRPIQQSAPGPAVAVPGVSEAGPADPLVTLGHELRTHLNAVIGFSELLAESDRLDARQRRYAAHILASGRGLLRLVGGILERARTAQQSSRPAAAIIVPSPGPA